MPWSKEWDEDTLLRAEGSQLSYSLRIVQLCPVSVVFILYWKVEHFFYAIIHEDSNISLEVILLWFHLAK